MNDHKHLKERSYYEEIYDRHTVEECRWYEEPRSKSEEEKDTDKGLTPGQLQWGHDFVTDWLMFQWAGNRYLHREESITESMERDRQRDVLMERARTPLLRCASCGRAMECLYKHINFDIDDTKREWVEFCLGCQPCKQSKTVSENGMEIPEKPSLCIKCNKRVESDIKKKNGKRYYIDTCKHCGHVEETVSTLDEKKKEPTQEEIERFEYDKKRFCLTSVQGERYKHWVEGMKRMDEVKKEQEANVEFYDKLGEVKKLNIAGLEKLLKTAIKKAGYADLQISMPPPTGQIILDFSVRDTEEKRKEHDSRKALEQAMEKVLEDTNWALMSEGIRYRLGLLGGLIRGYESEEDLQQLTKSRMKGKGKHVKLTRSREYASMFPNDIVL